MSMRALNLWMVGVAVSLAMAIMALGLIGD